MEEKEHAGPLAGLAVLITRPAAQAEELCRRIEEVGGEALRFPTLEIRDPMDVAPLQALAERLGTFDFVVFISANAVSRGLPWLSPEGRLPGSVRVAAIGASTARELEQRGVRVDLVPEAGFDSEALLALEPLRSVGGQHVLIVRGEGGRALLAEVLSERGARVEYAQVYRRARTGADPGWVLERARSERLHALTSTSNESLNNLLDMIDEKRRSWLLRIPLFVIGCRQRALALELGFDEVHLARQPNDAGIVEALAAWATRS
jgi:uroporphyrinogen-III synthase